MVGANAETQDIKREQHKQKRKRANKGQFILAKVTNISPGDDTDKK